MFKNHELQMAGGMRVHDTKPESVVEEVDLPERAVNPDPQEVTEGPQNFEQVVVMFEERREAILHAMLIKYVHLVRFDHGHIAIRAEPEAPPNLATQVSKLLSEWTEDQWLVSLSDEQGEPTIHELNTAAEAERRNKATNHPLVQAALETFPGATVEAVIQQGLEEFSVDEGN